MSLDGINGINLNKVKDTQLTQTQETKYPNAILGFGERDDDTTTPPSDAKIKTEMFKDEIMSKLDTSKSKRSPQRISSLLEKIIYNAQRLNGVQKNNLKPQGTAIQIETYNARIQELIAQMKDFAEFIGCDLSIVQDSKTGLYKLCINNKLFDIPERKVEIGIEYTDIIGLEEELMPTIVD